MSGSSNTVATSPGGPSPGNIDAQRQAGTNTIQNANIDSTTKKELLASLQGAKNGGDIASTFNTFQKALQGTDQVYISRMQQDKANAIALDTPGLSKQTSSGGTSLLSNYRQPQNNRLSILGG